MIPLKFPRINRAVRPWKRKGSDWCKRYKKAVSGTGISIPMARWVYGFTFSEDPFLHQSLEIQWPEPKSRFQTVFRRDFPKISCKIKSIPYVISSYVKDLIFEAARMVRDSDRIDLAVFLPQALQRYFYLLSQFTERLEVALALQNLLWLTLPIGRETQIQVIQIVKTTRELARI